MKATRFLTRLANDSTAVAAIEFALVAPIVIGLMLGMFQVSLGMNNYNSLRGIADDTARFAIVKFQDGTRPNEATMTAKAKAIGIASPYNLDPDKLNVTVDILDTTRVAGALEANITLTYEVPSVAKMIGVNEIDIDYQRSVFLIS